MLTAIDELGYVPDGSARSLRTRKTLIVASLIPDITNPFYPAFERGIQDVADANDYDLIAYNSDGNRAKELRCLRSMQRARVDGIIATPFQLTADDFSPLIENGVPSRHVRRTAERTAEPPYRLPLRRRSRRGL